MLQERGLLRVGLVLQRIALSDGLLHKMKLVGSDPMLRIFADIMETFLHGTVRGSGANARLHHPVAAIPAKRETREGAIGPAFRFPQVHVDPAVEAAAEIVI